MIFKSDMKLILGTVISIFIILSCVPASRIDHPSGAKVAFERGSIAPNFNARDTDGNEWELWALQGKKVILSFWSINSLKSVGQLEDFQEFYETIDTSKLILLGITCGAQEGDLIPFLAKMRVKYPNLIDKMGNICRDYDITIIRGLASRGASPFPLTVFINEHSIIERIISVEISRGMLEDFYRDLR